MIAKDKFGTPIKEGDYIVYPFSYGQTNYIRLAKVLEVKSSTDPNSTYKKKLTVWGVDDTNRRYRKKIALCSSKACISFPEKAIVIPENLIPKEYIDLLDFVLPESTPKRIDPALFGRGPWEASNDMEDL
jgi:hypothetical protein